MSAGGDDPANGETDCTELCHENEYVSNGVCTACPPGTVLPATRTWSGTSWTSTGENPLTSTATCADVTCGENERVASHVQDVASCSIACATCTTRSGCEAASGSWGFATVSLCVACSPGKSNAAGDVASTTNTIANPDAPIVNGQPQITGIMDTYCAAVSCGADEHVSGHSCESCPAGTVNPLSRPAYGCFSPMNTCTGTQVSDTDGDGSTDCALVAAFVTQRIESNCPTSDGCTFTAGTAVEADSEEQCTRENTDVDTPNVWRVDPSAALVGDDASGVDTSCAPVLCSADERVLDHACVACPAGTTNEAGDDSSLVVSDAIGDCEAPDGTTACDVHDGHKAACTTAGVWVTPSQWETGTTEDVAPVDGDGAACVWDVSLDTTCDPILCAENEHVSSNTCVSCGSTMENPAGDDASGSDTTCATCAENHHLVGGTCTACDASLLRSAGDPVGGDDTSCTICAENYYVDIATSSSVCQACAPGKTNIEGDSLLLPTGAACTTDACDTSCVATICARDEHVVSNKCEPCPAGTVNLHENHAEHAANIGDDASGADTLCTDITCDENQRVVNNVCESCPAGTVNPAGDNAAKCDTGVITAGCSTECEWDGRYCAVHTIVPEDQAFCDGDADQLTQDACEAAGYIWTRHRYTLPVWADGKGAGLKRPSDCIAMDDQNVAIDGNLDCDIYDNDQAACESYTPPNHCNGASGSDTSCAKYDHDEQRCLGLDDCFAYDGTDSCDAHDGEWVNGAEVAGDRGACLAQTGCQWQPSLSVKPQNADGDVCTWGAAASCTFEAALSFEDGESKTCMACPAGVDSLGRKCSCSLACTF
eukprot:COSAG02_NODE_1333_length_13206_cov_221.257801_9_plen_827_part_00